MPDMPGTAGSTLPLYVVPAATVLAAIASAFIPLLWRSDLRRRQQEAELAQTRLATVEKAITVLSTAEHVLAFQPDKEPIKAELQRIVAELDPAARARLALKEHFYEDPSRYPTLPRRMPPKIETPPRWADKVDFWRRFSLVYLLAALIATFVSLVVNSPAAWHLLDLDKITGSHPVCVASAGRTRGRHDQRVADSNPTSKDREEATRMNGTRKACAWAYGERTTCRTPVQAGSRPRCTAQRR